MKFYKAAAQQEVHLKFYLAQVGGADCLGRANLAADTASGEILAQ